ncbi:MAG: S1C family serine protease [Betaproteobacteria bacterium]|nr:S1C family serine protease [Betaproteobacteria bacterium]
MTDPADWSFPAALRPRSEDWDFDLERALGALVQLRAEVPEDAFTAQILGTERLGNGIVIGDDGLILTIGYLITEATAVWITSAGGAVLAGHPLAYDQATGFGLVMPLGRLGLPSLARGSAALARVDDDVLVAGHGGRAHALKGRIFDKREFAGYWEYVLDEALFATPAHPQWGGSALIGADGKLLGVGSLLVEEKQGEKSIQGNMFVPIDLLEPILEDLVKRGRTRRAARPWLGMYTTEMGAKLVVAGLASGGPADRAGVKLGDVVVAVAGERPQGLADLFRRVWTLGPAGAEVPLTVARAGKRTELRLASIDRQDILKKPQLH